MILLAIDGNSLINRAFYGVRTLTTKSGIHTNGVYGFMSILNKLMGEVNPDCVAVAFDLRAPTFRHKMYKEYKATRKGMPGELASQLPHLKKLLKAFGYHVLEQEGYEADDILGTLSTITGKGDMCYIATGDRDALQLVGEGVNVIISTTKAGGPITVKYDSKAVFEKYGVAPSNLIDMKAIQGDASDNIPGVAGIGEKGAADLVQRFGTIKHIYENIDTIDVRDNIRSKLIESRDNAFLSYELGTIDKSAPIGLNIADYKIGERDDDLVKSILTELEFFRMIEKLNLNHADNTTTDASGGGLKNVDLKEHCSASEIIEKIKNDNVVDVWAIRSGNNHFLLFLHGNEILVVSKNLNEILPILVDKKLRTCDSKELFRLFERYDMTPQIEYDCALAAYLINPINNDYSTQRLALQYGLNSPEINGADFTVFKEYAEDFANFSMVCEKSQEELQSLGMANLLTDFEIQLAKVLSSMENFGFKVDVGGLVAYSEQLDLRARKIESEIYKSIGIEFNLNSPKQLGDALFEHLGLPAGKKTRSGYSTEAAILEKLKKAHPCINMILEWRSLTKLKSTYCDGLTKLADDENKIHTNFDQIKTRTGRISSTNPNLQNIPIRTTEGRELRKFFVAADDFVLLAADYSQIELRVLAHIANDKRMIEAFANDVDIHAVTASQIFGVGLNNVTAHMRDVAKSVNFGITYGQGAYTLSEDLKVTVSEAKGYITNYMNTFGSVAKYLDEVVENARENGFVTTIFGRRRPLPEISSGNSLMKRFGERVARNSPVQGAAADIIKIAMIKVFGRIESEKLKSRLILQVHDELIVEAHKDEIEIVEKILNEEMMNAAQLSVPLKVNISSGKNWYDAK